MAELDYTYDGVQLDKEDDRPLIQDFLYHAEWSLPSRANEQIIPGLMLKAIKGKFLPIKNLYVDHVGIARHYIGLYGVNWRAHVRSIG
jgi:hypothetical protein